MLLGLLLVFLALLAVFTGVLIDVGLLGQKLWFDDFIDKAFKLQWPCRLSNVFVANCYHLRLGFALAGLVTPSISTFLVAMLGVLREFALGWGEESVSVVVGGCRGGHFELVLELDVIGILGVLLILIEELRVEVVVVVELVALVFVHIRVGDGVNVGDGWVVVVDVDGVDVLLDGLAWVVVCFFLLALSQGLLALEEVAYLSLSLFFLMCGIRFLVLSLGLLI